MLEDKARYQAQLEALTKNIETLVQLRLKVMGAIEYIDIQLAKEKQNVNDPSPTQTTPGG